jgi:hypothetical protein
LDLHDLIPPSMRHINRRTQPVGQPLMPPRKVAIETTDDEHLLPIDQPREDLK